MSAANYTTSITVNQSPIEVFNAINNVRGWWSEEIEGNTDTPGSEWDYHYQDVHRCKMKITELIPGKKVVWEVVANYFSFTKNKEEWIGNMLVFDIIEADHQTKVQFTQIGLVPAYECYDICENAWNTYIWQSLYKLITTGKGEPNSSSQSQTDDEKALSSGDFTSTFFVNQTPAEVFAAINNVRGWWQGEIKGNTEHINDEFEYRMKDVHYSKQKITASIPNEKIVWHVTDSNLSSNKDAYEWTGTDIIFDIKTINNKTQVRFTHTGLTPALECYDDCSWGWEQLMQQSLRSFITTGKGVAVFG